MQIKIYLNLLIYIQFFFSRKKLKEEAIAQIENPANFGYQCARHCMCEILGQVPCPRIVPLPKVMRGKYIYGKED